MSKKKENRIIRFIDRYRYLTTGVFLTLIAVFIVYSLLHFYGKVFDREYRQQTEFLEELSRQGSMIVEERLEGYVNVLNSIAEYIHDGDLQSEENLEHLQKLSEQGNLEFQRIGLADADGKAWVSNGSWIDIHDSEYFQAAMNKQNTITESRDSRVGDDQIFIVAVPVLDQKEKTRGVLYGSVKVDKFHLYEDDGSDSLMNGSSYVQVIDRNGAYIVKVSGEKSIAVDDNLFDGLKQVESSIPADQIIQKIQRGEQVMTEVGNGKEEYLIYFSPLTMNKWYMVTVLQKASIGGNVRYLLGRDIYLLLFQFLVSFTVVCIGISWYLHRDKKRAAALYQQLKFNDNMIREAVSSTKAAIIVYDPEEDTLKFMNGGDGRVSFPDIIEAASFSLAGYLPGTEKTLRQVDAVFHGLKRIKSEADFELTLKIDGSSCDFSIHVKVVRDEKGIPMKYVGIVEDVTKRKQSEAVLKEKAERDFLTKLYNRRSAIERISHMLKNQGGGAKRENRCVPEF